MNWTETRILRPDTHRRVPWRNGLGSTLEIATDVAEPGGAWTWRLSLADVPSRAAFSRFPGIDRHLAVLDGPGMTIEREDQEEGEGEEASAGDGLRQAARIAIPRDGMAYAFAGEDGIVGEPLGPGVRDANLMLDRRRWTGSLEVLRVRAPRTITASGDVVLVHVHGRGRGRGRGDGHGHRHGHRHGSGASHAVHFQSGGASHLLEQSTLEASSPNPCFLESCPLEAGSTLVASGVIRVTAAEATLVIARIARRADLS